MQFSNESKTNMKKALVILFMATTVLGCKTTQQTATEPQKRRIATFMTFQENNAEEAMNFYVSLFENSEVISVKRYGSEGPAKEGTILVAEFRLNGQVFMCSDSPIKHAWDFTPGVSVFVECNSLEELDKLFKALSEGGAVLMPVGNYGFSEKFAFVEDRFGVSWQLNFN